MSEIVVLPPEQRHHLRPPPLEVDPGPIALTSLLQHIHTYAFTTKSNLAKDHADLIAEAASRDFITTEIVPGSKQYGRLWKITASGLYFLMSNAWCILDAELAAYKAAHDFTGTVEE